MRARALVTLALLLAAGGVIGHQFALRMRADGSGRTTEAQDKDASRREFVLVYIGASTCGPSNDARLASWISEAGDSLRRRASRVDATVVTVGVARERNVEAGSAHLARTSEFDEISVGQRERNHLSQKYVSRDFPGIAATPQLLVVLREYDELPFGGIDVGSVRETLLIRRVGLQEVENWVRLGTPIPTAIVPTKATPGFAVPF